MEGERRVGRLVRGEKNGRGKKGGSCSGWL